MGFSEKLTAAITNNQTLLTGNLDANLELLGGRAGTTANFQDYLGRLIEQTQDLVCAYRLGFGFYEALGIEGFTLLNWVRQGIPAELPLILDVKHGDLNSSTVFARTIFQDWGVDAVTLSPYAGWDHAAAFLMYGDRGVFVLCRTSNPGAAMIQEFPDSRNPHYLQVVAEARNWGSPEQLYLEAGTTDIAAITKIRHLAPERTILLRSIWQEEVDLPALLGASWDAQAGGVLLPVPQEFLFQGNLRSRIQTLNEQISELQQNRVDAACPLWTADVCLLEQKPYESLILQLYDVGCLLFGDYVQASGQTLDYYVDLRKIISNPQVFHKVLDAYAEILNRLEFDRIAGIPYGSLPTATGLSLQLQHPMIFPRKEVKAHGTRRVVEGEYFPEERVVVVDDILLTGNSAIEGADKLRSVGLIVTDVVVLIDKATGAKDLLKAQGYQAHSVLTLPQMAMTLHEAGRINKLQMDALLRSCDRN